MNEDLVKSLELLIDESLAEIEELRKSDRFSASEVSIGDSASGMPGHDKNGKLGKEEDCDDEDEKKDKDDKMDKEEDMDKDEGVNRQADPNGGHHQVAKQDMGMPEGTMAKEEMDKEEDCEKEEGTNRQADPLTKSAEDRLDRIEQTMEKLESILLKSIGEEEPEEELAKSEEELMKSYVDSKLDSLEKKFDGIADLVKEIADAPMPSKSVSYKNVQPLEKSVEVEPLNKSQIADQLFELKKSGKDVDSQDIASVELGGPAELSKIAEKYNLK